MNNDTDTLNLTDSSEEESLSKEKLKEYVKNFQKKVEKKYKKSKTNNNFKFPIFKKEEYLKTNSNEIPSSLASLEGISVYDLKCQNFKREIEEIQSNKNYNEDDNLVEILSKIGNLDKNYLKNQIKKPDSILFKILCKSISKQINSLKESNSKYSHISSIYDSNNSKINFEINNKKKLKQNTKSYKKLKNINPKNNKKNNIKKTLTKNEQIYNNKAIKSINWNQKSLKLKKNNDLGNVISSCKNGKININPKLAKFLPKDIKILSKLKFKEESKNNKNIKKIKNKISSQLNTNYISKENNKNNDKITLTKGQLSALISKNYDKKTANNKIKKIKNNGVSIVNNTKNVFTFSNSKK